MPTHTYIRLNFINDFRRVNLYTQNINDIQVRNILCAYCVAPFAPSAQKLNRFVRASLARALHKTRACTRTTRSPK